MRGKHEIVITTDTMPAKCCKACQHSKNGCKQRRTCVDYAIETITRSLEQSARQRKHDTLNDVYAIRAKATRTKITER